MAEKEPPASEGEALAAFLSELESVREVKEIAGLETGFPKLSAVLNGLVPGLTLLVGPPGCGKTAFARQLLDQIARLNSVPALFFAFGEKTTDLRIRTLARLSGLESREIRRGAGYLLHSYGVPKQRITDHEEMAPGWEKLKLAVEQAKSWLDHVYICECDGRTTLGDIEQRIGEVRAFTGARKMMAVIDDSQRLGDPSFSLEARLPFVSERLGELARRLDLPLLATWPDLNPGGAPQQWAEKVAGVDVVMVMEENAARTKQLTEPNRAIMLHVVKNRGGEKASVNFDFSPALSKFTEQR